ncbi:hypothetical protein ACHAWF_018745 [Thalassiosira exigua]
MPGRRCKMDELRLVLLGFGSANRTLARMLLEKSEPPCRSRSPQRRRRRRLRVPVGAGGGDETRTVPWRVVAIVTRRHGRVVVGPELSHEVDLERALELVESGNALDGTALVPIDGAATDRSGRPGSFSDALTSPDDTIDLLGRLGRSETANVVAEAIPSDLKGDGEPAVSFLEAALKAKLHVASANKSPLAHRGRGGETYWKLRRLARENGAEYLHESAVMDGVPLFSLWKHALPRAKLLSVRGCLNSTTTVILTRMEGDPSEGRSVGESFREALDAAQKMGIVEADESLDVDGYDAAVKLRALLVAFASSPDSSDEAYVPTMDEIPRDSIRNVSGEDVRRAYADGRKKYRLVASADLVEGSDDPSNDGRATRRTWKASVRLRLLPPSDPLYNLSGADASVTLGTDVLGPVTVVSTDPTLRDTAYGLFSDILRIASLSRAVE